MKRVPPSKWTDEEHRILLDGYNKYGKKPEAILRAYPKLQRSAIAIKNKFKSIGKSHPTSSDIDLTKMTSKNNFKGLWVRLQTMNQLLPPKTRKLQKSNQRMHLSPKRKPINIPSIKNTPKTFGPHRQTVFSSFLRSLTHLSSKSKRLEN